MKASKRSSHEGLEGQRTVLHGFLVAFIGTPFSEIEQTPHHHSHVTHRHLRGTERICGLNSVLCLFLQEISSYFQQHQTFLFSVLFCFVLFFHSWTIYRLTSSSVSAEVSSTFSPFPQKVLAPSTQSLHLLLTLPSVPTSLKHMALMLG